jgi:nucleoid DNA-binding protein
MTKIELMQAVQAKLNCTKKEAELAVNTVFETLSDALAAGEKVTVSKFGFFEVRERSEKVCKNPQTHEPMTVPASKAPVFKASKTLKDAVNQK